MNLKLKNRYEKNKMEKYKIKGKKGVTLIALVVILVVLLILVGVTINLLTGQNRAVNKYYVC